MTDFQAINLTVDQAPDPFLRMVLADKYDDEGCSDMASGYRWLGNSEKSPTQIATGVWTWFRGYKKDSGLSNHLPWYWFDLLRGGILKKKRRRVLSLDTASSSSLGTIQLGVKLRTKQPASLCKPGGT